MQRLTAAATVHSCGDVLHRWEAIKEFEILDHELTVDNSELTSSLNVRRKVIESPSRPWLHSMSDGQRHG